MSKDPRKLIRILVGASLLLHTVVLVDYGWSPSGSPVFWRYSLGRLSLMTIYIGFLAGHVFLLIVISHCAAQSHILFGLVFASILYSTAESLIRVHGFGLITPAGRYRAEYWNQNQPKSKWFPSPRLRPNGPRG